MLIYKLDCSFLFQIFCSFLNMIISAFYFCGSILLDLNINFHLLGFNVLFGWTHFTYLGGRFVLPRQFSLDVFFQGKILLFKPPSIDMDI
jgi:hypothetical protein